MMRSCHYTQLKLCNTDMHERQMLRVIEATKGTVTTNLRRSIIMLIIDIMESTSNHTSGIRFL